MKHKLKKITVAMVICLFTLFTACQEEDIVFDESSNEQGSPVSRILKGQETIDAIAVYNDQLSKAKKAMKRSLSEFKLDESRVLQVIDKNGVKHFTYFVQDITDSKNSFSNIVITDKGGYKNTVLIQYEMEAKFADDLLTIQFPLNNLQEQCILPHLLQTMDFHALLLLVYLYL
jgi:hypothetical protein